MKILKIFGAVVAVHVVFFAIIFANPGCTSAKKASAVPSDTTAASSAASPTITVPTTEPSPISLASSDASSPVSISFDPNAPAISAPARYSPTRPGTPVAAALETKPVAEVTPASTYTVAAGDNLWNLAKKNHLKVSELAAANNLHTDSKLKPGQKLIIPGRSGGVTGAASTSSSPATYRVKAGETLATVARNTGTTSAALRQLNKLKSDSVQAGQELKLPPGAHASSETGATSAPEAAPTKAPNGSVTHVVKSGETLSAIAQKYQVKYSEIATANSITDPGKVRAGMTLVIPGWQAPKSAKATEAAEKASNEAPVLNIPGESDPNAGSKPATDVPVIKIEESTPAPGN